MNNSKKIMRNMLTGAIVGSMLLTPTVAYADPITVTNGTGTGDTSLTGTVSPITSMDVTVPIGGINFAIDTNGDISAQGAVISSDTAAPLDINVLSVSALGANDTTNGLAATTNQAPGLVPASTYTAEGWNNLTKAQTTSQIALALKQVDVDGGVAGTALTSVTADPSKVTTPVELGNLSATSSDNKLAHLESGYSNTVYCGINLETDTQYTNYGKAWVNASTVTFRYSTVLEFCYDAN